jgi:CBS domain containing-hemolysin-like protein
LDSPYLELIVIFLGLLGSAFFSGAETALTALSETKARQIIDEKNRGARALQKYWLEKPNHVLTTILVGNNIVNLFMASYITVLTHRYVGETSIAIATGITTLGILIFGEITPKTFAKVHADKIAPIALVMLTPLYIVCWRLGVVWILTNISRMLVKALGGEMTRSGPFVTEDDIAYMIVSGKEAGVIEEDEGEMLESVMEFGDTIAREVMIPRTNIHGLAVGSSFDDVVKTLTEHGHSRLPVYEESIDNVTGFFHAKDLFPLMPVEPDQFKLGAHLRQAFFVPEAMKINELLKEFQERKTHMAIVVDENGGTAGVISLEDILEELVGEIRDEHDENEEEEPTIQRISENHLVADGGAYIDELADILDIEFPEDAPYDTVGGFFQHQYGKIPQLGSEFEFEGWQFVVQDADEKRVITLDIHRLSSETGTDEEGIVQTLKDAVGL